MHELVLNLSILGTAKPELPNMGSDYAVGKQSADDRHPLHSWP